MNTTLRRHLVAVMSAVLLFGVLGVASPRPATAHADPDCVALGGTVIAEECVVSAAVSPGPGPFTLLHTLHVTGTGHIDASPAGITINVNGQPGLNLLLDAGAVIEADDDNVATPNTGASDITINVSGSADLAAGSRISADNNAQGGTGGDIIIDVDGDMIMRGTADPVAPFDHCRNSASQGDGLGFYNYGTFGTPDVLYDPSLGAVISAHRYGASSSAAGGNITLTVGFYGVPPTGTLTMERCSLIDVSSAGSGGEIEITAGRVADLDGLVLSESGLSGTGAVQARGGGPITVFAGCGLTVSDTGVISSKGQDPGADLVLLKSCEVLINGVVQSTAPAAGHVLPNNPPNRCNDDTTAHPPGLAEGFTACVRILGQNVTIDASGSHNGNVNVDGIRAPMKAWIDIFATEDITILGDVAPAPKWAVSADAAGSTNTFGGVITVKAVGGALTTTGQAVLKANVPAGTQVSGQDGGIVTLEAFADVALDGSFIEARGKAGTNGSDNGGVIAVRSFNGAITSGGDASGHIDATGGVNATPGTVTLTECAAVDTYLGTVTPAPTENRGVCGGAPSLPADAAQLLADNAPIWAACVFTPPVKSGMKFNDLDNSGSLTAGDTPIADWPINLLTTANGPVASTTTAADGTYSFTIAAAGSYKVCEGSGPAGFVQTYPNALTTSPTIEGELIVNTCPAPNTWGYQFTVASGDVLEDNDFGNFKRVPECKEDLPRGPLMTRTVNTKLAAGGGSGTAGDPTNYLTVQAAYDAAKVSPSTKDEVIGLFSKTTENVLLDNYTARSMTITQCESAQVTSPNASPAWRLTANKKLLIIGPDAVAGNFGWLLESGGHELKSIRANNASVAGVSIGPLSNSNKIGWNRIDGNATGIEVAGDSNTLTGGSLTSNTGVGVHFAVGASNNILQSAKVELSGSHAIFVEGTGTTLKGNKANSNGGDGFRISGTGTKLASNESNQGGKENGGAEYRLTVAGVNQNGNKADNIAIPKASAPQKCQTFPAVSVCE